MLMIPLESLATEFIDEFLLKRFVVEAEPVKRAEWIVCGDGNNVPWMCSHCGKTTAHKYKIMYGKYCPNCGAKMEREG